MKKYLLLFVFIPLFSIGQTFTEINDLIDANLASGTKITAIKHREVEHALLNYIQVNLSQSGDIKVIKCDIAYLNANFEVDGLGKNLRLGWAICNGNNGTENIGGRTIIGYGTGYSTFSAIGGNKDAVVVAHSHTVTPDTNYGLDAGDGVSRRRTDYISAGINSPISVTVNTTGVSGTDKNLQPYIVELYIQKL